jgi:hypothetical protein
VDYTGVYLTSGGAQELALKPAEIIVGPVAAGKSNIKIASGVIEFRLNTTVMLSIDTSGVITIGEVAADKPNIKIDASDILFRTNTDTNASINAASGTATFNSLTTNILFLTKSSQNFTGGGDKEINVGPTMDASYVLMTTDSNCNLIGISEGFSDGQMIIVLHISGNNVVVVDNSGSVTAGVGPIRTGTGADRTITGRGAMILIWNDSSSWWETISIDT